MSNVIHYGSNGQAECGASIATSIIAMTLMPEQVTCPKCKRWLPIVAPVKKPAEADHSDNRRCRLVFVAKHAIITLLSDWRHNEFVNLPLLAKLPDDYRVIDVHWDMYRDCFACRVWSASFNPVPDGWIIPAFDGDIADVETIKFPVRKLTGRINSVLEVVTDADKQTIAGEQP